MNWLRASSRPSKTGWGVRADEGSDHPGDRRGPDAGRHRLRPHLGRREVVMRRALVIAGLVLFAVIGFLAAMAIVRWGL